MKQLRNSCVDALTQFKRVLEAIKQQAPEQAQQIYADSNSGKHCRHALDHFVVLKAGLETGLIDYNKRNRESLMETNLSKAIESLNEMLSWLNSTEQLNEDRPIEIKSEISCTEVQNVLIQSSLKRELHYIVYHSIHHVAYCVLLLKNYDIALDPSIGLAANTASYLRAVS